MFTEEIEKLKREYTDKFVVVDATRPELARFRDVVGRVKTVNMSGRALVEFDEYHQNIGWYDIDLDFLKVVDEPPPKAPKAEAKKAAPKTAAPAAKEKPAAKPAAAPAAKGKGSVADILAAARGGKAAAPAAPKSDVPSAGEPASAGGKPAPTPKPAAAPAKVDRSKMSVADMLAAARAGGSAGTAPPPAPPKAAPAARAEQVEQEHSPSPETLPALQAATPSKLAGEPAPGGKKSDRLDKSKMSIDDMVAWCRQHDTK